MRISDRGIEMIKQFEGLRLIPYQDVVGIWTWGYGHAKKSDENVPESLNESEAEGLLRQDLEQAVACVDKECGLLVTQNQFDALCSFVFNLGCRALQKSTLLQRIFEGSMDEAAAEFLRWNKAGGKVIDGLSRRRHQEMALFLEESHVEELS